MLAKAGLEDAAKQGILIVGWHAWPKPGPMEGAPVFANVTTTRWKWRRVAAMKAIADSNGKAGVVVFADSAAFCAKRARRAGDGVLILAELLEDSPAGEERGAVGAFRHSEKLLALVVEQDPAAVARSDRRDSA